MNMLYWIPMKQVVLHYYQLKSSLAKKRKEIKYLGCSLFSFGVWKELLIQWGRMIYT